MLSLWKQEGDTVSVFGVPDDGAVRGFAETSTARGRLVIASCRAAGYLSDPIAQAFFNQPKAHHPTYLRDIDFSFSDSETCVRLKEHVGGADVFLLQTLLDPRDATSINHNYLAFLIAARAFREHGALHVTGILPYMAYARQDKPTRYKREPTTARLMADLSDAAGLDRVITWHPHSPQLRGFYGKTPMDMLDPSRVFADELARFRGRSDSIVIAPDAGAAKLCSHVASLLSLPYAVAAKTRVSPTHVETSDLMGAFSGKKKGIIIDDIMSSGGTLHALFERIAKSTSISETTLLLSHNACNPHAREILEEMNKRFGLTRVLVTDSMPQTQTFTSLPFFETKSLSKILSSVINRVHNGASLSEIFRP